MMTSALLSPMLMLCYPLASVAPPRLCARVRSLFPRARLRTSPRPGEARAGGCRDRERVGEPDLSTDERAELERLRAEVARLPGRARLRGDAGRPRPLLPGRP